MKDATPESVIEFWLGSERDDPAATFASKSATWFRGGEEVDRAVKEKFTGLVERASRGELDEWAAEPAGRLALILVLDQLRRNLYRDTAAMVAEDAKALALLREGLDRGDDRKLTFVERAFFYMPFQHAEDRALQAEGVKRFDALADEVEKAGEDPKAVEQFRTFASFAERHRDIVERFGRFPHRNRMLGRTSTPEEEAFLKEPGSSF